MARIDSTRLVGDNALNGDDLRLNNDQFLRSRNEFDTADIGLLKLTSLGRIQLGNGSSQIRVEGDFSPAADNSYNLGIAGVLRWSQVSALEFNGSGFTVGIQTTPSGVSGAASLGTSSIIDGAIFTGNNAVADSSATRPVYIETGNKTAGTGNSGDIFLTTGTSSGGSRGSIKFNALEADFTNAQIRTANDQFIVGRNSANNANINMIKIRSDNLLQVGNGSLTIAEGNFAPFDSNVYSCGAPFRFWSYVYTFGLISPYVTIDTATSPSGNTVSGFKTTHLSTPCLFSDSYNAADAVGTAPARIETGNLANASSTGITGGIFLKTGNNSGSNNTGEITLETGTPASGTRGRVVVNARTIKLPISLGAPTATDAGEMYYDTGTNKSYTWDGSTWQAHF